MGLVKKGPGGWPPPHYLLHCLGSLRTHRDRAGECAPPTGGDYPEHSARVLPGLAHSSKPSTQWHSWAPGPPGRGGPKGILHPRLGCTGRCLCSWRSLQDVSCLPVQRDLDTLYLQL